MASLPSSTLATLATTVAPTPDAWHAAYYMDHLRKYCQKTMGNAEHPVILEAACETAFLSTLPSFRDEILSSGILNVDPRLHQLFCIAAYDRARYAALGSSEEIATDADVEEWMDTM